MSRLLLLLALAAPIAFADSEIQVEQVLKRDFHPRGQAGMDRIPQDGLQRVCTEARDRPPQALARTLEADQQKTLVIPEGSLMGDWKRGERLAQSGQGMTWNDKPGNAGGSCYNCHELSPKELSFGTIGPSLRGFGRKRGSGADAQRYVYSKIYNAKAFSACSQMPRFGTSGTLTAEQIKDLVALLLDPSSPVNQ
ncbi:MAG TPA: sulfur oxidation c-type cytochrome SoxX [Burkholderiales bacterium]|nr:sulfur oxidation c-type cytochrome SoxX [Burkholderiales bacterium]